MNNSSIVEEYRNPFYANDDEMLDVEMDCEMLLECLGPVGGEAAEGVMNSSASSSENQRPTSKKSTRVPSMKKTTSPRSRNDSAPSNMGESSEEKKESYLGNRFSDQPVFTLTRSVSTSLLDQVAELQQSQFYANQNPDSAASFGHSNEHPQATISLDDLKNSHLEASKDRRRERNKVLARKTRCKKKAEFEFLRKQLIKLQSENDRLKEIVTGSQPAPMTAQVLLDCDVDLPENVTNVVQELITTIENSDSTLMTHCTGNSQRAFCICNPATTDYPIVYSSPGFVDLTGYSMHHIIGRPCLFLDGADTDRREQERLQAALANGREEVAVVRNYRRNGTPFWNRVQISPLRDAGDKVAFFVAIQYEVGAPALAQAQAPSSSSYASTGGGGMPFTTYLSADRSGVSLASAYPSRMRRGNSHNNLSQRFGGGSGSGSGSSSGGMVRSRSGTNLSGIPSTSIPSSDSSISALRSVITQEVHHHHHNASNAVLYPPPHHTSTHPSAHPSAPHHPGQHMPRSSSAGTSFADDHSSHQSSGSTSCGYSSRNSSSNSSRNSSRNSSDNDNRSTDNDNRSDMSDADGST